jgi:hypothetical protein
MSENLKAIILDASTGEVIERDFTEDEIAHHQALDAEFKSIEASRLSKESARASALAKLAALGLTEEEIAAL